LGKQLFIGDIDSRMMEEFIYFLRSNKKNLKINTVKTLIGKLTGMLDKAGEARYRIDNTYKEVTLKNEDVCTIYLTPGEIETIFNLKKISKEQHAARERFIVACCTGLRYSDVSRLTPDNLHGGVLHIKTIKTGAVVDIPLHWMVEDILNRNGQTLPPIKTQQSYNKIIKRICRRAGIRDKILYERTEGLKVIRKNVEKWTLVTSHTARRSLATNMYLAGILPARIMLITGHKTEQAFFAYIRINRVENAKTLSDHPFFKKIA
jgi:integrase